MSDQNSAAPQGAAAPALEYCFTIWARVAQPVHIGDAGDREGTAAREGIADREGTGLHFAAITGGEVEGTLSGTEPPGDALSSTELTGTVLPGGGDWWVDRGVTTVLDARYLIELGGHAVEVVNRGYWRPNAAAIAAMESGREPAETDLYYRTAPVFQTDAPELAWLTESVFVGYARGELDETGEPAVVVIRVYRVA